MLDIQVAGAASLNGVFKILGVTSGACLMILSTMIMFVVLESIGFFQWAVFNLLRHTNGSGVRLYWYIIILCFLMTLFFNSEGSILITTPIIIQITAVLKLKQKEQFPYLISGALVAIASSAPIGVSNIANLISLEIVGLDLNTYVETMFIPSMLGIITISLLLFYHFRKDIPKNIPIAPFNHPHQLPRPLFSPIFHRSESQLSHRLAKEAFSPTTNMSMFKGCINIVVLTRAGLFIGADLNIPIEWIGVAGALLLTGYRWYKNGSGLSDVVIKTPWYTIPLVFSLCVVVYALHHVGLTMISVAWLKEALAENYFSSILISGGMLTLLSGLFNSIPSLMMSTLTLTEMGLATFTLKVSYLASIIGADMGSLMIPMGTVASLIWMVLLKQNGINVSWMKYIKTTFVVIPLGLFVSLLSLYVWVGWLFF